MMDAGNRLDRVGNAHGHKVEAQITSKNEVNPRRLIAS